MTGLPRRHVLLGGLTLAAVAAYAEKPVLADPVEPLPPIEDRIGALERRHGAVIGLFALNLASGRTLAHRAQDLFAMCSTFKTYAAARVLQMVERDELSLDQKVFVEPGAIVPNSPVTGPRGAVRWLWESCARRRCRSVTTPHVFAASPRFCRWYLCRFVTGGDVMTTVAREEIGRFPTVYANYPMRQPTPAPLYVERQARTVAGSV